VRTACIRRPRTGGSGTGCRRPRRLESGTIRVDAVPADASGRVVYARVSSHDQRHDLDRQVARLAGRAAASGHAVGEVVTEAGSGLNGKRPRLRRILPDPSAGVLVVEHRDPLARFGVKHLEAGCGAVPYPLR
jgi:putative resolvase